MDVSHFKRFLHKIEGFKFVSSDFLELTWEILDLDNKRDTVFFILRTGIMLSMWFGCLMTRG
jgi:hypothetical protein